MILLEQYLQGRDKTYFSFYTKVIEDNAEKFLTQLNGFFKDLGLNTDTLTITSGWRPPPINSKVGGAPSSYHLRGRACDFLDDASGTLDAKISLVPGLLAKWNLWLESPSSTPGWVHLDNGDRPDRPTRIFLP